MTENKALVTGLLPALVGSYDVTGGEVLPEVEAEGTVVPATPVAVVAPVAGVAGPDGTIPVAVGVVMTGTVTEPPGTECVPLVKLVVVPTLVVPLPVG